MKTRTEQLEPRRLLTGNGILFHDDFETDLSGWESAAGGYDSGPSAVCCPHSVTLDAPARSGNTSARFEHAMSDPIVQFGHRAELSDPDVLLLTGSEYWIGVSTHLPADYEFEPDADEWQIVFQLHGTPDFDLGESWRTPAFGLYVIEDHWEITLRASADAVNSDATSTEASFEIPLEKGGWSDWAFHVNLSQDATGFAHAYKNGQLVASHTGPTGYNDAVGPYIKTGIYRPSTSTVETRIVNIDEMRVGDNTASLSDVMPPEPNILSNGGGATASLTVPKGPDIFTNVESSDNIGTEGDGLTYSLTAVDGGGLDNSAFDIDTTTGDLKFAATHDFSAEPDQTYLLQVSVTDADGNSDVQDMTIEAIDAGIVAWWEFEEGTTDTAVEGSHPDEGTLIGTAAIVSAGTNDSLLRLDGNGDRMELASSPDINENVTERSIAMWFRPDLNFCTTRQVLYQQGGATAGINIFLEDGLLYAGAYDQSTGWDGTWLTSSNFQYGQWNHVTLTIDSFTGEMKLHVNDNAPLLTTGATAISAHEFGTLGAQANVSRYPEPGGVGTSSSTNSYVGHLDEVRIYDLVLADTAVTALVTAVPPDPDAESTGQLEVDNCGPGFNVESGTWNSSASVAGYRKNNYAYARGGDATAKFSPNIPTSGNYEVFATWTSHANRATNALFEVTHAGGTTSVAVDQTIGGGTYQSLGVYAFDAGLSGSVAARTLGTNGFVIADAVKLVPTTELPSITIDNGHVAYAEQAGVWKTSGLKGTRTPQPDIHLPRMPSQHGNHNLFPPVTTAFASTM